MCFFFVSIKLAAVTYTFHVKYAAEYRHHAFCRRLDDGILPSWLCSGVLRYLDVSQVSLSSYIDTTETKLPFIKFYKLEWKC